MIASNIFTSTSKVKLFPVVLMLIGGFMLVLSIGTLPALALKAAPPNGAPISFTQLAEAVSPAVVNIRTVKTIKGGGPVFRHFQRDPFGRQQPFKDFFEKFFGEEGQREYKQPSLGSGFIIDKSGLVVTNNHVIEDADQIKVKLGDDKEFDAEVVGRDPNTDLALIKIKSAKDLPSIKLGDSDKLKVGQWVVAIGSPFGLERTVTAGIVSAKGRVIGSGPYDDFIQTDASINPGNSGGPLLNMDGEVIGINTAIVASGQGIGFAIPINLAKGVIAQLKTEGEVTRGWLGVAIQDITSELAEYYGIKDKKGVFVAEVFEGDPAAEAGIQAKDIIIAVNDNKIENSRQLTGMIAQLKVGEKAKVTVLRGGKKKNYNVKIAKRPEKRLAGRRAPQQQQEQFGIRVSNLTAELAQRFNLAENAGVIVSGVESGSKGAEAGIRVGDIIKEVNHKAIENVNDYSDALEDIEEGESINLFVWRKNAGFLVVKLKK